MGWFDDISDIVTGAATGGLSTLAEYGGEATGLDDSLGYSLGIGKSPQEKAAEENRRRAELLKAPDLNSLGDLGPSALENLNEDPRLRGAQMSALDKLQEIYNSKGLTAADKANLQQIAKQEALNEKGQRESITQNAQARGTAGSGLELSGLLGAEQGSADRASSRDLQVNRDAQARMLDALDRSAGLASNIRGQDYNINSAKANAQDIISRFNFGNKANNLQQGFNNNLAILNAQNGYNTQAANANADRLGQFGDVLGGGIQTGVAAYTGAKK